MQGRSDPRPDLRSDPRPDLRSDPRFDLILASASPRRRQLLEQMGLVLRLAPTDLDETPQPGEKSGDCVRRLAAAKCDAAVAALAERAREVERRGADGDADEAAAAHADGYAGVVTVLAADTMVSLDGAIFGKAADAAEARAMLARLTGRRHEVTTAYRVWRGPATGDSAGARVVDRAVTTLVSFRLLKPAEIEAYAGSGQWEGKAGGYGLQGIAGAFTTELRGSYTNVIGLPLAEVLADLMALGALADYPRAAFGVVPVPEPP